ncbi:MAG: glycosyltransferase [Candidatus Peregrinibacteria bacterium]|nr:glycosyltransferase [Candidatus Peregrinibacteria bacterium]
MNVILAFGYHNQQAPRHWNLKAMLEREGWEVRECHTSKKGVLRKYVDLWRKFRRMKKDARSVLVTFPGHYLVPLAWLLTRFPRKTLIFDAFISAYDTLVLDRKKFAKWNPAAWAAYAIDFLSCHLADEVLIDTEEHRKYFIRKFRLNPKSIYVVYLGTREDLFTPAKHRAKNPKFEILFYGTYIPLQGIEHIIEAAKILADHPDIHFTLIGTGQTHANMRALAHKYALTNITFRDRVAFESLPDLIRASDLCLGIFGTSDKAKRVIPHKVYDAVACSVPVLTADTPAIHEKFTDGKEVILCRAGDPEDMAKKILRLQKN